MDGRTSRDVCAALDISPSTQASDVKALRAEGWEFPRRRGSPLPTPPPPTTQGANGTTVQVTYDQAGTKSTVYRCPAGHKVAPSTARGETTCARCADDATRGLRAAERAAWEERLNDRSHWPADAVNPLEPAKEVGPPCQVDPSHGNQYRMDGRLRCAKCGRAGDRGRDVVDIARRRAQRDRQRADTVARVVALRREGLSLREVATEIGVSVRTVARLMEAAAS